MSFAFNHKKKLESRLADDPFPNKFKIRFCLVVCRFCYDKAFGDGFHKRCNCHNPFSPFFDLGGSLANRGGTMEGFLISLLPSV